MRREASVPYVSVDALRTWSWVAIRRNSNKLYSLSRPSILMETFHYCVICIDGYVQTSNVDGCTLLQGFEGLVIRITALEDDVGRDVRIVDVHDVS